MKKIILIGSSGKMGTMIQNSLQKSYEFQCLIDKNHQDINNLKCDAILDFSSPDATMKFAPVFIANQIPYICGTTGLTEENIQLLKKLNELHHSHFTLLSSFDLEFYKICDFIKSLKPNKITIEEFHNISKKDLPSGSALIFKKQFTNIPIKIISLRQNINYFRHIITMFYNERRITINYEVYNREVYLPGIQNALEKTTLKGFFERL